MPTKGVPTTHPISHPNPEAYHSTSKLYFRRALGGIIYEQFANTAAICSTDTATSILNPVPTGAVGVQTSHGTTDIPPDFFAWYPNYWDRATSEPGGILRAKFWGTIQGATGTTPNLTMDFGVIVPAADTYRVVATTGALALIDLVDTAVGFEWDFWMQSRALGVATVGSLIGAGKFTYYYGTNLLRNTLYAPVTIEVTNIDTTIPLKIESQVTWGTSAATNSLIVQGGYIEALG